MFQLAFVPLPRFRRVTSTLFLKLSVREEPRALRSTSGALCKLLESQTLNSECALRSVPNDTEVFNGR